MVCFMNSCLLQFGQYTGCIEIKVISLWLLITYIPLIYHLCIANVQTLIHFSLRQPPPDLQTQISFLSSFKVSTMTRTPAKLKCKVFECTKRLRGKIELKNKLCKDHSGANSIIISGVEVRFCQHHRRCHELDWFEGDRKKCKAITGGFSNPVNQNQPNSLDHDDLDVTDDAVNQNQPNSLDHDDLIQSLRQGYQNMIKAAGLPPSPDILISGVPMRLPSPEALLLRASVLQPNIVPRVKPDYRCYSNLVRFGSGYNDSGGSASEVVFADANWIDGQTFDGAMESAAVNQETLYEFSRLGDPDVPKGLCNDVRHWVSENLAKKTIKDRIAHFLHCDTTLTQELYDYLLTKCVLTGESFDLPSARWTHHNKNTYGCKLRCHRCHHPIPSDLECHYLFVHPNFVGDIAALLQDQKLIGVLLPIGA